ncbi:GerAB/ArcD/ProY family transporter [Paenibacillus sp. YIM B09110]|uniref:GerAB/ArcD/ProY family transporter n=1 Tax=Paenibacillus sp. YIM B09110 TaxID=3126102 RepID=UPI00301C2D25
MTKIQISNGMFIAMIVNLIFVKAIGVTEGVLARSIGQDMWIATLIGTLQGIVMMYLTYLAIKKTPDLDFIGLGRALLGQWFAKLVALLIFLFYLAAIGPVMITFVYHLQEYFLPEAPISLFVIASLLVGAAGCYYGLEVMARLALVGLLFIFLLNVMIMIGSLNEFDILNLLPVLEHGFPRTAQASLHFDSDWAMSTMLAALLFPFVKDVKKRGGRLGMAGIVVSGIMISIWAILEAAALSAEVTGQYTLACMKLARNAHIGNFLQRYEMIMIACYSLSMLFMVMFCIYGTYVSAARILGLKKSKTMIFPASLILGIFGYWIVEDHFRAMEYLEQYWPIISLPIAFGLPLLMLSLRMMFGKKLKKEQANA